MQHLKDIVRLLITLAGAAIIAGMITLVAGYLLSIDPQSRAWTLLHAALALPAGVVAGNTLMRHLHWSFRFTVLAVPLGLAVITLVFGPLRFVEPYLEGMVLLAEVLLPSLALDVGVLAGAGFVKYQLRGAAG